MPIRKEYCWHRQPSPHPHPWATQPPNQNWIQIWQDLQHRLTYICTCSVLMSSQLLYHWLLVQYALS
jgi:hypothetical protein